MAPEHYELGYKHECHLLGWPEELSHCFQTACKRESSTADLKEKVMEGISITCPMPHSLALQKQPSAAEVP